MIQQRTILKVADNSGAKTVRCIKVLGGFKRKTATLGDLIVVSIQTLRNKAKDIAKVKKKEVYRSIVVRIRNNFTKKNGLEYKLHENAVVLVNKQGNPIGSRVLGPLPKTLKKKKYQKFISISSGTF